MVLSVIFSTFDNITKSLQHGFLQHSNFSRKVCNILLCNNWKIAKNSFNICLQQKCCKKIKFTTFFKCCKKKANVAKKKPMVLLGLLQTHVPIKTVKNTRFSPGDETLFKQAFPLQQKRLQISID